MKTILNLFRFIVLAAPLAAPLAASAVSSRTFVSGVGSDVGTCTATAPCRSFAYAITQTSAGGEIIAIDTAGFGAVTIDKSLTIATAATAYAGISAASGHAIDIAAGAFDTVVLRGLAINGVGGSRGIFLTTAGSVHIERCRITGFSTGGQVAIHIKPTTAVDVVIADSVVRGNFLGIFSEALTGGAADSRITILRTRVQDNPGSGLHFFNITRVAVIDSFIGNNGTGISAGVDTVSSVNANVAIDRTTIVDSGGEGVNASGTNPPRAVVHISNSTISGNDIGLHAIPGGFLRVMSSQINGNVTGVATIGTGVVDTLQNNMCYGNGASCAFTGSIPLN